MLDRFRSDSALRNLRAFFDGARTYTTEAVDVGELSPWVTWPSFHRGLSNQEHGIRYLGQAPDSFKGTPIWQEYRKRGLPIGVCGSLQSWPPAEPGDGGFYIPDTFAQDAQCIPKTIEPFQRFNLGQVKGNGRVVRADSLFAKELLPLVLSLPSLGLSAKTFRLLAEQLVRERLDKTLLSRRPVFQAVLLWDIFKKLFSAKAPPAFSTFFTNHVAGVMHRYWHNVFPEDFGEKYRSSPAPYLSTMHFAFEVLDAILGDALDFQRKNPDLILVFATSMGQGPKHRPRHTGVEVTLVDIAALLDLCDVARADYEQLLAMVPQVVISMPDPSKRAEVTAKLERLQSPSGARLFQVDSTDDRLSITFICPFSDIEKGGFDIDGRRVTWQQAGMVVQPIEPGTGYHVPEGAMAVRVPGQRSADTRERMSARDAKAFLMQLGGLN
jgi:hypothetical protein